MRPWQLGIAFVFLLGIVGLTYPPLQHSLQSAVRGKAQSTSENGTQSSPKNQDVGIKNDAIEQTIYEKVNPAVVTVYGTQGLGTGMLLRPEGLLLTNKHLVNNSALVKVETRSGQVYDGRVVDFDLQYDLALVKLENENLKLPTVTLAESTQLQPGDRVFAIGNPEGKAGTLTTGTFLRTTEHGSLQISAGMLSPGNSGGPLLKADGTVIGVNKGLLKDKTGLATSLTAIAKLVQRYDTVNQPQ